MSRSLGFVGLIIVVAIGAVVYMKQVQNASPAGAEGGGNPQATIDIAGVKNDLLGMAQAERAYQAREGKYASLDDLVASGDLTRARARRGDWEYSSEVSDTSFKITATYKGADGAAARYVVDESMQVRSE